MVSVSPPPSPPSMGVITEDAVFRFEMALKYRAGRVKVGKRDVSTEIVSVECKELYQGTFLGHDEATLKSRDVRDLVFSPACRDLQLEEWLRRLLVSDVVDAGSKVLVDARQTVVPAHCRMRLFFTELAMPTSIALTVLVSVVHAFGPPSVHADDHLTAQLDTIHRWAGGLVAKRRRNDPKSGAPQHDDSSSKEAGRCPKGPTSSSSSSSQGFRPRQSHYDSAQHHHHHHHHKAAAAAPVARGASHGEAPPGAADRSRIREHHGHHTVAAVGQPYDPPSHLVSPVPPQTRALPYPTPAGHLIHHHHHHHPAIAG